jgi:hypothetical protein
MHVRSAGNHVWSVLQSFVVFLKCDRSKLQDGPKYTDFTHTSQSNILDLSTLVLWIFPPIPKLSCASYSYGSTELPLRKCHYSEIQYDHKNQIVVRLFFFCAFYQCISHTRSGIAGLLLHVERCSSIFQPCNNKFHKIWPHDTNNLLTLKIHFNVT